MARYKFYIVLYCIVFKVTNPVPNLFQVAGAVGLFKSKSCPLCSCYNDKKLYGVQNRRITGPPWGVDFSLHSHSISTEKPWEFLYRIYLQNRRSIL